MMVELVFEILRVVSSPYAVSLKNLSSIVKSTSHDDLQEWANSNPCQIPALAGAIISALEFCPYGLSVVEGFGHVAAVRDAMLIEKKTLLDGLLRNAKQNENSFEKYSPACLALLSNPLPPEFPPPALLVPFFLRSIEIATKKPSQDSIKAIYTLVSNGYDHLAELLTPAQKIQFRDRMAGFINTADRSILLLALATLACIGNFLEGNDVATSIVSEDHRQTRGNKDFFHGKKAMKLLQLVTNLAIDLASKDSNEYDDIVEELRLATVIVAAVGDEVKDALPSSKDILNTAKLLEKAQRPGLDERVLKELLIFSIALFPKQSPIPGLAKTVGILCQRSFQNGREDQNSVFLPPAMAGVLGTTSSQEFISEVIRSTLTVASSSPHMLSRSLSSLQDRILFIKYLSNIIPESQQLRTGILSGLVTNEFSHPISAFLAAHKSEPFHVCQDREVCPTKLLNSQKELASGLCTLLLRAGMYAQRDEYINLDPALASLLLEKQAQLFALRNICPAQYLPRSGSKAQNIVTLFEASATPDNRVNGRDWRQHLYNALQGDASRQHESIVAAMGEICRDLETRCEGVERPLHEEEERSKRLRGEVEQLRIKLEREIEGKLSAIETYENIEREKRELKSNFEGVMVKAQSSLDEAIMNAQNSATRIQELEDMLQTSREEVQQVRGESLQTIERLTATHYSELRAAKVAADKLAVDHMAILNDHQEIIEELRGKCERLEHESNKQQGQYEKLGKEKLAADEKNGRLNKELSDVRLELECKKNTIVRKDNEIETLERSLDEADEEEKELKKEIDSLETRLEKMEDIIRGLENKIEETAENGLKSCQKLDAEHNSAILRLKLAHEEEVHKLHTQLQQTRENWNRERDTQFAENRNLMKKINKLHAYQEQKAKEAENLARQLIGTMSKPGDFAGFLDSGAYEPTQGDTPKRQPVPILGTIATQPTKSRGRRHSSFADIFESPPNSPNRNGSTPKRSKTKQTPTTPKQTQTRIFFKPAKTILSRKKSTAILEKENHTPTGSDIVKETPTELDTEADEGGGDVEEEDPPESNYGGTALFTSTPRLGLEIGVTSTGRLMGGIGSQYDDDTTMDF